VHIGWKASVRIAGLLLTSICVAACIPYPERNTVFVIALLGLSAAPPPSAAAEPGEPAQPDEPADGATTANPSGPPWWDVAYIRRRRIDFGVAHNSSMPPSVTMRVVLDTLATAGVRQVNGDDVRLVWHPTSGVGVERDRLGINWNTASTTIAFRTHVAIDANAAQPNGGSYYIYYGAENPAVALAQPENVYWYYDDFERPSGAALGLSWNSWLANGNAANIVDLDNGLLRVANYDQCGPPPNCVSGARTVFPLGELDTHFYFRFRWTPGLANEPTWSTGMQLGDQSVFVDTNRLTGAALGLFLCDGDTLNCDDNDNSDSNPERNLWSHPGTVLLESNFPANSTQTIELFVDPETIVDAKKFTYHRNGTPVATDAPFFNIGRPIDMLRFTGSHMTASAVSMYDYFDDVVIELTPPNPATPSVEPPEKQL
jgi:hypothetical protein